MLLNSARDIDYITFISGSEKWKNVGGNNILGHPVDVEDQDRIAKEARNPDYFVAEEQYQRPNKDQVEKKHLQTSGCQQVKPKSSKSRRLMLKDL